MTRSTLLVMAAVVMVAVACTPADSGSTTTGPQNPITSIAPADSTTSLPAREVTRVDCEEAPKSVVIVCEAYDLIQAHYVDPVDDSNLVAAAISGLLALDGADSAEPLTCPLPTEAFTESCDVAASEADSEVEAAEAIVIGLAAHALDPNSAYFDEEALQLLEEEQSGEIEGIGALVSPEDHTVEGDNKQCGVISETCRLLIVSTIAGAPAEAVGLQRDDAIVGVDGEAIIGWTIDQVTSRVRGPAGTPVLLTIERDGNSFDVSITRAAVVVPVLESEQFGTTGYIHLRVFSDNADEQFETAILDLLAGGIDTLVVDLRDNPGGLLTTAIEVTSVFLPDGEVIVTQGPDERRPYRVSGAAIVPEDVRVLFVVNKGSASASEVVSAVLQERGVVQVVGENTFGKNTVQQRFNLSNGGALKLTIARWLTPQGLDYGGVGVTPDIEMTFEPGIEAAALVEAILAAA